MRWVTGWLEAPCHYYCMKGAILTAASSTLNRNYSSLRINWFCGGHDFLSERAKGLPEDVNWNWDAERPRFASGIQNSDVKVAGLFWTEKWMRRPQRDRRSGTQAPLKAPLAFKWWCKFQSIKQINGDTPLLWLLERGGNQHFTGQLMICHCP